MPSDIRVLGTGQLLELQRRLRAASGPRLQQNMARRVRHAAEPLKSDLQDAIRRVPIRGQGGSGRSGRSPTTRPLRATIARAIRISVRTTGNPGARIWIDRSALPSDMRALPNKIEDGRWRHPVFGNRRRWVAQYGAAWWAPTQRRHEPRMRAEMERILNDIERWLS